MTSLLFLQNIVAWMKDKSEVEIVDLVLKLREKLVSFSYLFGFQVETPGSHLPFR